MPCIVLQQNVECHFVTYRQHICPLVYRGNSSDIALNFLRYVERFLPSCDGACNDVDHQCSSDDVSYIETL